LWREKSDSVAAFIDKEILINPDKVTPRQELYNEYRDWCLENKEKVTSDRMFFTKLEASGPFTKGFSQKKGEKTVRVMRGLITRKTLEKENKEKGQENLVQ